MKLLILDKDGTLTRPKSGQTFVQHPEDQELIEGVAEAIARYVADRWTLAIASNQGGCQVRWCHPSAIPVNSYCHLEYGIVKHESLRDTGEYILLNELYKLPKTRLAKYKYKMIDMAIAEMHYAMNLASIKFGCFCPDNGESMIEVDFYGGEAWGGTMHGDREPLKGTYRKPDGGMINHWINLWQGSELGVDDVLFVGDRDEDQQAAANAKVNFIWAEDWRNANN